MKDKNTIYYTKSKKDAYGSRMFSFSVLVMIISLIFIFTGSVTIVTILGLTVGFLMAFIWIKIQRSKNYKTQKKLGILLIGLSIFVVPVIVTFMQNIAAGIATIRYAQKMEKEIKYKEENGNYRWRNGIKVPDWIIVELDVEFLKESDTTMFDAYSARGKKE